MGAAPTAEYNFSLNEYFTKGSLTCLTEETIKNRVSPEFPLMLNIEPTNACNAKCYYCPREITAEKQGVHYMDKQLYKSIIDQITPDKLIMINYHKDGEPLMHPELPWMIRYAKEKNAAEILHLNTNGTLLRTDRAKAIVSAGIDDITVSIDAARESTYRDLKKIKNLEKVERGVRELIEYRDSIQGNTLIRVKIMEFDSVSSEEIEEFCYKWKDVADQVQVTGTHSWSNAIDGMEVTDGLPEHRFACLLLWYLMAVNSNGLVSKCNYDWDYSGQLGDAKTQSLRDIWQGHQAKIFRNAHLNGQWSCNNVCKNCVAWAGFKDMQGYLEQHKRFYR
jgi:radical SAM protein with 4Fe4S-binding SPASM domain